MTLKIAVIGAGDMTYPRHEILIEGLKANGVEVTLFVQHKRTSTRQRWLYLWRTFPMLRGYDGVILLAFNQTSAMLAGFLSWRWGVPLVVDYLVGLSDIIEDRAGTSAWKHRLFRQLDRWHMRYLTLLTDTTQHITYFEELLNVRPQSIYALPVGARTAFVQANLPANDEATFVVQYLGTFIPFHGVETILDAAHILRDNIHIRFELIGEGQTLSAMQSYAHSLQLDNVQFVTGYHRPPEVFDLLQRAHLFLGVLGASPKTDYVIPTKIYELLALDRPLITAESHALQSLFQHGEHLLLVPPANATALADAILMLSQDTTQCRYLAQNALQEIHAHYLPAKIGEQLLKYLHRLIV